MKSRHSHHRSQSRRLLIKRVLSILLLVDCLQFSGCGVTFLSTTTTCKYGSNGEVIEKTTTRTVLAITGAPRSPNKGMGQSGLAESTNAQFALLVPNTWTGLSTQTLTTTGDPFIYNGTEIVWLPSAAVGAKAQALAGPPTPFFKWVGFESNSFVFDPAVTSVTFDRIVSFGFAPLADLHGAGEFRFFWGDSSGASDQLGAMPGCAAAAAPVPTLSEWGLLLLAISLLLAGAIYFRRRKTPLPI